MKYFLFSFALIALLGITSCQKEVSGEIISTGTGSSNSNDDYIPSTAGSQWNYISLSIGNYTTKALGTDTVVNGRTYKEFDQLIGATSRRSYIGKSNKVYYAFGTQTLGGNPVTLDYYILLKDTAVGATWTNTINTGFSNAYYKYTVTGRDLNRTVLSKNYNSVIELTMELSVDDPLGGGILPVGGGKDYYAKGVGAIESFNSVNFFGIIQSDTTRLLSYTLR